MSNACTIVYEYEETKEVPGKSRLMKVEGVTIVLCTRF